MAAKKKQPKRAKKKKPGPDAERLKIEGGPIAAFDKLIYFKPQDDEASEGECASD